MADLIGYAATITGVSFMLPQLYKTYTTKSVEDISWGMLALLWLNCVLWLTYGMLSNAAPVALTNAIGLVVSTALILLKIRYRNNP